MPFERAARHPGRAERTDRGAAIPQIRIQTGVSSARESLNSNRPTRPRRGGYGDRGAGKQAGRETDGQMDGGRESGRLSDGIGCPSLQGCSNRASRESRGAKKRRFAPNREALNKIPRQFVNSHPSSAEGTCNTKFILNFVAEMGSNLAFCTYLFFGKQDSDSLK